GWNHVYVGFVATVGWIARGPMLAQPVTAHGQLATGSSGNAITSGDAITVQAAAGAYTTVGPLLLAIDFEPGARDACLHTPGLPTHQCVDTDVYSLGSLLLDLDARAGVWVTPKLTVAIEGAIDVTDSHAYTIAAMFGVHVTAFDGLR